MSKPTFVNGEALDFKVIRTINKSDLCDIFSNVSFHCPFDLSRSKDLNVSF